MDTRRINWPTVALIATVATGAVSTLAIVLALTPESLLIKLVDLNWAAVLPAVMTTVLALFAMMRRAGLLRGAPPAAAPIEAPEADAADDEASERAAETTKAMGPRAMRRQDTPPAG
jgi:hypothetical protein